MENINLDLDKKNELVFDVNIQTNSAVVSPPVIRLLVKEASEEISYVFHGKLQEDKKVMVTIPPMEKKLSEGSHDAVLEVIIENRHFEPMKFNAIFEKPIKVEAKSVVVNNKKNILREETDIKIETKLVSGGSLKEVYDQRRKK